MSSRSSSAFSSAQKAKDRVTTFWERVTDGLELHQLWGQFKSEARASYRLYSADVDWHDIDGKSKGKIGRYFRSGWALFQAMLMKLSPARRVLLLLAIVLLLFQPSLRFGRARQAEIHLEGVGVAILFVLLAIELADRVTMKRDLEIAREIQEWLVPEHPPEVPGLDIAFATRPQNTVAGDYFDAFVRPAPARDSSAQTLLVAVADVAGKSIPAALLMATFQASLHTLMSTSATLDEIVANLDQYCRAHSLDGRRFTTAFLAELDVETREMVYVNAGHNPPILRRTSGEIERLEAGGPPFGIPVPIEARLKYHSGRLHLHPGDMLFVFTDGLTEGINEADQEYGEERLLSILQNRPAETAAETLNSVMKDVNAFVGNARQHDDITALVLRVRI
jgi:serine phosphatase RsbU (regulator of sigma subunit)